MRPLKYGKCVRRNPEVLRRVPMILIKKEGLQNANLFYIFE
jgi:hypothetical protein